MNDPSTPDPTTPDPSPAAPAAWVVALRLPEHLHILGPPLHAEVVLAVTAEDAVVEALHGLSGGNTFWAELELDPPPVVRAAWTRRGIRRRLRPHASPAWPWIVDDAPEPIHAHCRRLAAPPEDDD